MFLLCGVWLVGPVAAGQEPTANPPTKTDRKVSSSSTTSADREAAIKPRWELRIPSVSRLIAEVRRSHSGVFAVRLGDIFQAVAASSSEGVDADEAAAVIDQIRHWLDSPVDAVTFAPDTQGRPQWAVRVHWPLHDLHARVAGLLSLPGAQELFSDLTLQPAGENVYEVKLPEETLGYLLSAGPSQSIVASHVDLRVPDDLFDGRSEAGPSGGAVLLASRLHLTGTEKDSGATFLSSFSAVTAVDYVGRVGPDGDWIESLRVHWPPISGMGAKVLFSRVKGTFFVPRTAFGSVVLNAPMLHSMLDGMAGFGPQVVMEEPGKISVVGDALRSPITAHTKSAISATLLPGTGFLPLPDVVLQLRTGSPDKLVESIRRKTQRINQDFRERDQKEPWREESWRGRPVFFREGGGGFGGVMLPAVMRPVLFTAEEKDAKGKPRSHLVLGWTSTSPRKFVRRWLDLPRSKDRRFLPSKRKTNGQLWLHWSQLYRWIQPYIDLALSGASVDVWSPRWEEVKDKLSDALLSAKLSYSNLLVTHQGPVPMGALAIPSMWTASTVIDESGGSDLARERLASRRLKVLYHHCRLFHQDFGRWPAEVRELDGYVDFAGHPQLLQLKLSSKKRWHDWFEDMFQASQKKEEEQEDEDEDGLSIKEDLYVINWGRDRWSLGYASGTLDHLEKLYIDQDGKIHRVEKKTVPLSGHDATEKAGGTVTGSAAPDDHAAPKKE